MKTVLVLAGDGIGQEIVPQAMAVLEVLRRAGGLVCHVMSGKIGVAAWREHGKPLPEDVLGLAQAADAILFGTAGDPKFDHLGALRPDSAIGGLRKGLGLYGSLRLVKVPAAQAELSPLRHAIVSGTDLAIVREIAGDVYASGPKGQRIAPDGPFAGESEGFDSMRYTESEVRRIARLGFSVAAGRRQQLVSADKANVLETSRLWRRIVDEVAQEYPTVRHEHMFADNLAMQLVTAPTRFDTIVAANLFGDILSDIASVLTGSIGLPASVMFNETGQALYEPGHGSAPDIAGHDRANPIASIRCVGLMAQHSFGRPDLAEAIEAAIAIVLADGLRTAELWTQGHRLVGTSEMGAAVTNTLKGLI